MPFKLSETSVDTLLDKLSSDDDFRKQFQANPRKALAAVGHKPASKAKDTDSGLWSCLQTTQLANKDAIKASRDVLRKQLLTSQATYNPVNLEVAKPQR